MNDATAPGQTARPPRPKSAKAFMVIMTIVWLLALVPAGMFAMMFPFAFDQGPSEQATRIALGLIGGPFVLIGTLLLAWLLFAARLIKPAILAMFLPALYFVIFLLVA